jgi:hypothetical protein
MNGEGGIQSNLVGIFAQQARPDAVERTSPVRASVITPALSPMALREIRSIRFCLTRRRREMTLAARDGSRTAEPAIPRPGNPRGLGSRQPPLP